MKMCILLGFVYGRWGMPARPEIAEVYDHFADLGHQSTWVLFSEESRVQRHSWRKARIFTVPQPRHHWFPIRLLQYIPAMHRRLRILLDLVDRGECDLIVVEDDIPSALIALFVSHIKRTPFVFHDASPDPEILLEMSQLGLKKPAIPYRIVARLLGWLDLLVMRKADLVLAQSDYLREHLIWSGIGRDKIVVAPNGAATNKFSPALSGESIRSKYGLVGYQVVVYIGTMDKLRHLDVLVHAFAEVTQVVPDAKLFLIGDGNDRQNLEALAGKLGLARAVVFTGSVPYPDIPEYGAAGDIAVSPIPPKQTYKVSSPLKLFEYMAAGKPVVANYEIPEHKYVLVRSHGGVLVSFSPASIAAGLIDLLRAPEKARTMGRAGRQWVVEHRSYQVLAQNLERVYLELQEASVRRGACRMEKRIGRTILAYFRRCWRPISAWDR